MVLMSLAMFIGLFAFGGDLLGYRDPDGMVQLALTATFHLRRDLRQQDRPLSVLFTSFFPMLLEVEYLILCVIGIFRQ